MSESVGLIKASELEVTDKVSTPSAPPPKLNRAMRRRLMKKLGTFKRISKIGKVKS